MYTGNLNYYSIVFSTKRFPQKGGNHAIMYFSLFIYFIDIYSKTMASGNSPRDIGSLKIKPLHDLEIWKKLSNYKHKDNNKTLPVQQYYLAGRHTHA